MTFRSLMAGVWGVPSNAAQYIALCSALGLILSGLISIPYPRIGRVTAIVCTIGIGSLYIPATASLVPTSDSSVSPFGIVVTASYLAILAFCLLFPQRLKYAKTALVITATIVVGIVSTTLYQRISQGEFSRPAILFFKSVPSAEIRVSWPSDDSDIAKNIERALAQLGVTVNCTFMCSTGDYKRRSQLILIYSDSFYDDVELHFLKSSFGVYYFNGKNWLSFPEKARPILCSFDSRKRALGLYYRVKIGSTS